MMPWNRLPQDYIHLCDFTCLVADGGSMHGTMFPLVVCSNHCRIFLLLTQAELVFGDEGLYLVHSQQGNVAVVYICVYTHAHTHIYIYIHIDVCMCVCSRYVRIVAIPVTSGEELGRVRSVT